MAGEGKRFGVLLQEARLKQGLSQEDLAAKASLHRTAVGLIESGEREPLLSTAIALADALGVPIADLIKARPTRKAGGVVDPHPNPELVDITNQDIVRAVEDTYAVLDLIDSEAASRGGERMAQMVELANLSSMVGNIFGGALARQSQGRWIRNGPHKHPELIRPTSPASGGIEIKVALEDNSPKGHLPKPGPHISVRYVLGHSDAARAWKRGERGDTVVVWEVRAGVLKTSDFNLSNTEGDSGKTAVVNAEALHRLRVEYFDRLFCPYPDPDRYLRRSSSVG